MEYRKLHRGGARKLMKSLLVLVGALVPLVFIVERVSQTQSAIRQPAKMIHAPTAPLSRSPLRSRPHGLLTGDKIMRSPVITEAKKKKVWGDLRQSTRTSYKWIPKTEEMTFQVIGDQGSESFSHEDVVQFIREWFEKYPNSEVHIGADSKKRGGTTSYVCGICLYNVGRGGTVLYHRKMVPTAGSNHERLWVELEIAMEVSGYLRKELGPDMEINVHIDYNSEPMYKVSNALYSSGMAWIKSAGYNAVGKPDAWAASSVADKLT
eukprot:CAMPEP_0170175938 /NCGR_PEP_ID=MMETSP0040_2-20121228/8917_1 /TAXON_ID=641309 /ORGANISM="Lotharella oceanica, Strain CCMP622" /LENGTH=264 /DNA_ID=CAMNT_0010418095 /DNA_START=100 /DNA_END=894 /DNA_ORIENTATION=+